jgi:Holliday junction resolvase RusA-like endonuclease
MKNSNKWTIIISNSNKTINYKTTIPNLDEYINDTIYDLLNENGMWEEINDIDSWNNWGYQIDK